MKPHHWPWTFLVFSLLGMLLLLAGIAALAGLLRGVHPLFGDSGTLRSPAWLASASRDCATPRAFVVRRRNEGARAELASAGRPMFESGRDFIVFGLCAELGRVPR